MGRRWVDFDDDQLMDVGDEVGDTLGVMMTRMKCKR